MRLGKQSFLYLFEICAEWVSRHMVPYDQPEAALVGRHRPSKYVWRLTCHRYPGYDYPMGEEHSSDGLIGCIVSCTWLYAYKLGSLRPPRAGSTTRIIE